MKYIFGLVGPSGAGKSTLILEMVKRYPEIKIIRSITTRPLKDNDDAINYAELNIPPKEFDRRQGNNEFASNMKYAGNKYAYTKKEVDSILKTHFGICATIEESIFSFQRQGYGVIPIKIIPKSYKVISNPARVRADVERSKIHLDYKFTLINSFLPGGKEKAILELSRFIDSFIKNAE